MHPGGAKQFRPEAEEERARAAWLLALDLADEAEGVGFLKAYSMPGKVGRGSSADVTMARRIALYIATMQADVGSRALAKAAGLHRSTIGHHVETVEDLRGGNPRLNTLIDEMERRFIYRAASLVMAALGNDRKASEGLA